MRICPAACFESPRRLASHPGRHAERDCTKPLRPDAHGFLELRRAVLLRYATHKRRPDLLAEAERHGDEHVSRGSRSKVEVESHRCGSEAKLVSHIRCHRQRARREMVGDDPLFKSCRPKRLAS